MDNYDNYILEDFVWDEPFREWALRPTSSLSEFWTNWMTQHPEKEPLLLQAKEIVCSLKVQPRILNEQEKHEIIVNTLKKINTPVLIPILPGNKRSGSVLRTMPRLRRAVGYAAALLLVLSAAALIIYQSIHNNAAYSYEALTSQYRTGLAETVNTSAAPLALILPDGSKVTLQKNARLSYAPSFAALDKREVYLSGDALFDIRKNAAQPFFVYTNGIVTRVLGTSFTIKTDSRSKKVIVELMTGKVEVYEQKRTTKDPLSRKGNGVILLPNQKVVYSAESNSFESTLADNPKPVEKQGKSTIQANFLFEDVPLSQVIQTIRDTYNIEVEVENEAIYNCHFTGDISGQNLYRKLDAICQSTKTSYEIKETKIFIRGSGCN